MSASRFLEVCHSTTERPIRFKLGTMFNYELNFGSTAEFFGSDQSIDQDIDFSDRANQALFQGVRGTDRVESS